jgi:hypothetical protein
MVSWQTKSLSLQWQFLTLNPQVLLCTTDFLALVSIWVCLESAYMESSFKARSVGHGLEPESVGRVWVHTSHPEI